jgi:uracil-DNA glycosylase
VRATGTQIVATIRPSAALRAKDRAAMYAGLVADLTVVAELLTR